jgi:hypothetical protein
MDSPLKDWSTLDPVAIDRGLADLDLSLDRTTKLSYARVADTHSSPLARPLDSTQAREPLTVLLPLAFFFLALCLPLYFQNPPFAPPLCLLHILPFLSLRSPVSILYISAYYNTLVSLWLLTRVAS